MSNQRCLLRPRSLQGQQLQAQVLGAELEKAQPDAVGAQRTARALEGVREGLREPVGLELRPEEWGGLYQVAGKT